MISIQEAIEQYRLVSTPTELAIYKDKQRPTLSSEIYSKLTEFEKELFNPEWNQSCSTIIKSNKLKEGQQITIQNLYNIIINPSNKNIPKNTRSLIYSSYNGERPVGNNAYMIWNGFQIIDMDIKDRAISEYIKPLLFKRLCKYNWFVGIVFSSSGKGLHIYTKIRNTGSAEDDLKKRKLLFQVNFRHKYSFVYLSLLKILDNKELTKDDNTKLLINKDIIIHWLDMAMFKPAQGAYIPYDDNPLFSTNFFEDYIYVNFDNIEGLGDPDVNWVTYPDLLEVFNKYDYFIDENKTEVKVTEASEPIIDRGFKIHYKHYDRWRLANTLVKLYGIQKAQNYLRRICSDKVSTREIQGDCRTAATHDKPVDQWAINQLNRYHGFNIKTESDKEEKPIDVDDIVNSINEIKNPLSFTQAKHTTEFLIKQNEYLGTHYKKILKECDKYRITLLEAGPGMGKTEMVKMLVDKGFKVLLIMPFTSTLIAKIDNVKNWKAYYGNRKPNLVNSPGIAMTIDKFTKISPIDIIDAEFDYIFIDESHLLFQSEYRNVMFKAVDSIRNNDMKVILMSGTPMGETEFFPDLLHLIVRKEDSRIKEFNTYITGKPIDNMCHICNSMADDIIKGRHILFPSNRGTLAAEQFEGLIGYFLERKGFDRKPVVNYYKKSNVGEQFMDDINFDKSVKNTDVLICSTYLSVGVDILDKYDFVVYFNNIWMPQEVEQFANRLRSHDLYIKLFISNKDTDGNTIDISNYKPCNFGIIKDEIKDIHSLVRTCNAMIERSPQEYRNNPVVKSIISNNAFIKYNEIENKYYLDETSYKMVMFERRYREFVQQLPVLIKGMQTYGYRTNISKLGEYKGDINEEFIKSNDIDNLLKQIRNQYKTLRTKAVDELLDQITEDRLDIYKSTMQGEYKIVKGNEFKEEIINGENTMIVKNIEIFEKVIPVFTAFNYYGYSIDTIKDIFEYCRNKGSHYSFAKIIRIKRLANIIHSQKMDNLDISIKDYIAESYKFANQGNCLKDEYNNFILAEAMKYARKDSTKEIDITHSPLTIEKLEKCLDDIFKCLFEVKRSKKNTVTIEPVLFKWNTKEDDYKDLLSNISNLDDLLGLEVTSKSLKISKDS